MNEHMEENTIPEENNHLTSGQGCLSTVAVTSVATLTATSTCSLCWQCWERRKRKFHLFTALHSQIASVYDQVERLCGRERGKGELSESF